MRHTYATREQVKAALDIAETARTDAQIDRVLQTATDSVDGQLHRTFTPWTGVRYFNWPERDRGSSWRLDLQPHALVTLTSLTSGGTAIDSAQVLLEPVNEGPPFTWLELDRGTAASWTGGDTPQRDIAVSGTWDGDPSSTLPVGTLSTSITDSATTLNVSRGAAAGVGDLLLIDSERLLVTGRTWLDSTVNLSAGIDDSASTTLIPATGFDIGESILIDAETMLVVGAAGTNTIVRRAWDGSVLAAHLSGADVYASRTLTVQRAQGGTTAAAHSSAAVVTVYDAPAMVRELCLAEAIFALMQQQAGYARSISSGDAVRQVTSRGLQEMRDAAFTALGRVRKMAV
jgi:hypothetical protein